MATTKATTDVGTATDMFLAVAAAKVVVFVIVLPVVVMLHSLVKSATVPGTVQLNLAAQENINSNWGIHSVHSPVATLILPNILKKMHPLFGSLSLEHDRFMR